MLGWGQCLVRYLSTTMAGHDNDLGDHHGEGDFCERPKGP